MVQVGTRPGIIMKVLQRLFHSPCSRSQQLAGLESFLPLVTQCSERKQGLLLLQRARAFDNIKLFRLDQKPDFVENHMVLK